MFTIGIELNQLPSYSLDQAESDLEIDVSYFVCLSQSSTSYCYLQKCLEAGHQLAFYTTSECILRAEIDAIVLAIGGIDILDYPNYLFRC